MVFLRSKISSDPPKKNDGRVPSKLFLSNLKLLDHPYMSSTHWIDPSCLFSSLYFPFSPNCSIFSRLLIIGAADKLAHHVGVRVCDQNSYIPRSLMYNAYDTHKFGHTGLIHSFIRLFHFETRENPLYWKSTPSPLEYIGNDEALLTDCAFWQLKTENIPSGVQTY